MVWSQYGFSKAENGNNQEDEGDVDETDLQLTQEELQECTQQWHPFDKDDEEDVPDQQPEPKYFSQSSQVDLELEKAPKRFRPNHDAPRWQANSVRDTEDTWNLEDKGIWKIFKKNEQFYVEPYVGHPRMVFTIIDFFTDRKVGKMARCHVAILARETFLGQGNPDFDEKKFKIRFDSKYVSCYKSQNKPLRKLIKLKEGAVDFSKPEDLQVHFDHPEADTKGCGSTVGFFFNQLAPFDVSEPLIAMDLFAGGGGMSCGMENGGFKVSHAVDNDPNAEATLRHNHPKTKVFCQKVEPFLDEAKKSNKSQGPYDCSDVVHGHFSSPCQGFSRMNTNGKEASKQKNNILCMTFPKGVIGLGLSTGSFENVTGMLDPKNIHWVKKIVFMFLMERYQVRVGVVDSSRYGDPQKRERVIILVSAYGWPLPDLPTPTHGPGTLKPLRTPRDAIGDLEEVEPWSSPGIQTLTKPWRGLFANEESSDDSSTDSALEVKHHVRSHDGKHPSQKEYSDADTLRADEPANTVLCGHAIKHYSLDRALTNLEMARLQSFPDHWIFAGSAKQIQKQIGNAVPVGLATAIAKEIRIVYKTVMEFKLAVSAEDRTE